MAIFLGDDKGQSSGPPAPEISRVVSSDEMARIPKAHEGNAESVQARQNRALELVAHRAPIDKVLAEIARMLESAFHGDCTAYLTNSGFLSCIAAPSLPSGFAEEYDRSAASVDHSFLEQGFTRAPVFFEDAGSCRIWRAYRRLPHLARFPACYVAPILSNNAAFQGCIALHLVEPKPPGDIERDLMIFAARLTALALEQHRLLREIEVQARYDPLTTLPNRAYFLDRLEAALSAAKRRSGMVAVLFIDLDRFKQINDTLGHAIGDRLLTDVGLRIRHFIHHIDLAARMGGDEFAIILSEQQDENSILSSTRELLNALRAPYWLDGHELFITASIGLSIFPEHGSEAGNILRKADVAMYRAKRNG